MLHKVSSPKCCMKCGDIVRLLYIDEATHVIVDPTLVDGQNKHFDIEVDESKYLLHEQFCFPDMEV